ncbi:hypothetical protein [Methanosarcina sp.]|jgi:hypothetical protein|uniref:hypothetical protein n=1 Tax=Methanosarcina sp. TaxID=2213 RepID=UPI002988B095|nr:hypothetical protein [Methanosarcina sp.]MDW5549662.1 hypothetical protein [Methanosarcina sp.]MDW5552937.1 hypothetical protein [Methanosarcina sp.]MDW5558049.1 hypothetical protein [Methanosarcina sp.]
MAIGSLAIRCALNLRFSFCTLGEQRKAKWIIPAKRMKMRKPHPPIISSNKLLPWKTRNAVFSQIEVNL